MIYEQQCGMSLRLQNVSCLICQKAYIPFVKEFADDQESQVIVGKYIQQHLTYQAHRNMFLIISQLHTLIVRQDTMARTYKKCDNEYSKILNVIT